jgi:hypothetical protein
MVPSGRLVVAMPGGAERVAMVPPALAPVPTASQFTGLAQPTPIREATPDGADWLVQVPPPFVEVRMLVPPTEVQVEEVLQLTEVNAVVPAGVPRSFQTDPPSVVPMT